MDENSMFNPEIGSHGYFLGTAASGSKFFLFMLPTFALILINFAMFLFMITKLIIAKFETRGEELFRP